MDEGRNSSVDFKSSKKQDGADYEVDSLLQYLQIKYQPKWIENIKIKDETFATKIQTVKLDDPREAANPKVRLLPLNFRMAVEELQDTDSETSTACTKPERQKVMKNDTSEAKEESLKTDYKESRRKSDENDIEENSYKYSSDSSDNNVNGKFVKTSLPSVHNNIICKMVPGKEMGNEHTSVGDSSCNVPYDSFMQYLRSKYTKLSSEEIDEGYQEHKPADDKPDGKISGSLEELEFNQVLIKEEADDMDDSAESSGQEEEQEDDPVLPCEVVVKVEQDEPVLEDNITFTNSDSVQEAPAVIQVEARKDAPSSIQSDIGEPSTPMSIFHTEGEEILKIMSTKGINGDFFCPKCGKRVRDDNYITDDTLQLCECKYRYGEPNKTSHNGYYVRYMGKWTCQVCGEQYGAKQDLAKHMPIHNNERRHRCELCGKCFILPEHLAKHFIIHSSDKKYKCDICGNSFVLLQHLSRHLWAHSKEKQHGCHECGKVFSQKSHMLRHISVIHKSKEARTCDVCGKSFNTELVLNRHKQVHTGEREFECQTCGKGFLKKGQLTKHQEVHNLERKYKCDECGKTFLKTDRLERHMILHFSSRCHKCELCGKGFSQKGHLARHLLLLHSVNENLECRICGLCFTDSKELSKHLLTHCSLEDYKCEKCGKGFADEFHLSQHMLSLHYGKGTHECEICGKCFPQKRYLARHMPVHSDVQGHRCHVCGKYFTQKIFLEKHHMLHSTDQSHKCEICGKCFHQKRYLLRHAMLHSSDRIKAFKCEICGNGFLQESYLFKHYILIHNMKRDHKCFICSKSFFTENYLASHLLEHTSSKPIQFIKGTGKRGRRPKKHVLPDEYFEGFDNNSVDIKDSTSVNSDEHCINTVWLTPEIIISKQ